MSSPGLRFRIIASRVWLPLVLAFICIPALAQSAASQPKDPSASASVRTEASNDSGNKLPSIPLQAPPSNFDLGLRSRQVLAHLSAVIRYYRMSLTPIQKVGEPSDALYREQAILQAKQIANYAFLAAKAEASLLSAYGKQGPGAPAQSSTNTEADRLQTARTNTAKHIEDLKAQQQSIDDQLKRARPKQAQLLLEEQQQVQGELELYAAMSDALSKIVDMSDTHGHTGLAADVDQLQRTAPELTASKVGLVPVTLESFSGESSAGVSTQAKVLFQLLGTRHAIDLSVRQVETLHGQAMDLRTPLVKIVRSLMQKGQEISQQPGVGTGSTNAEQFQQTRENFDSVTATFKVLSNAAVPLSQEIITLEQSRSNLLVWRVAVQSEYHSVLRSLLWRILVIAIALGVVLGVGEAWRRGTTRYIHDLRRRRQLLGLRRVVIGLLSGLVVLFGFVTQFNSLATFAGFITAGLAVGLQTILLSVAAYFFIIGRYGVRVGDRITVAGVTGDVIEVGLVRFYVMELAGSGTELQSTGRVAVFSNAILFQAGTPLYKQLPGTEYAWHELTAKLGDTGDYRKAASAILALVEDVYGGYRKKIEQQQQSVEGWMNTHIGAPKVESRVLLVENGLQLLVRFPVEIHEASAVDEQVTEAVLQLMREDESVKQAVTAPPAIKAAVKG